MVSLLRIIPLLAFFLSGNTIESKLLRGLELNDEDVSNIEDPVACLTAEQCEQKYYSTNLDSFFVGNYSTKGCFSKNDNIYFGVGGTDEEMKDADLPGIQQRVWCNSLSTFGWIEQPPSSQPSTTVQPSTTGSPTYSPTTASPTYSPTTYFPTTSPSLAPTYFPCIRTFDPAIDDNSIEWNHGTRGSWAGTEPSGTLKVYVPENAKIGDTLFLFLSRTDGFLPLEINEWTRGAECLKSNNGQAECMVASDCIERIGPYCLRFKLGEKEGSGRDLGTVMFYRRITAEDPGCWTIDIPGTTNTWAVITAIPNVNEEKPIRRASGRSCDDSPQSVFPNEYGKVNDVLLLSQCFDDTAELKHFGPPDGMEILGWTNGYDDAGFLYGKRIEQTGYTGELTTEGSGRSACKDALLSVVVNRE